MPDISPDSAASRCPTFLTRWVNDIDFSKVR
jgi:hypothetical protein